MEHEGAISLPLLRISFLDKEVSLDGVDAIIFTSKNGVRALERLNPAWKNIPSYAISKVTASAIEALGGTLAYAGKQGNAKEFCEELKPQLSGKRALFVRAQEVAFELGIVLRESGYEAKDEILYETSCSGVPKIEIPKHSCIIFGSPSGAKCFFERYFWDDSFLALTMGEGTKSALPKKCKAFVVPNKSIAELVKMCKDGVW